MRARLRARSITDTPVEDSATCHTAFAPYAAARAKELTAEGARRKIDGETAVGSINSRHRRLIDHPQKRAADQQDVAGLQLGLLGDLGEGAVSAVKVVEVERSVVVPDLRVLAAHPLGSWQGKDTGGQDMHHRQ